MTGERLGRLSLRADAAYCAVLGVGVIATAPMTADALTTPAIVLITAGSAAVIWAAVLCWMLVRLSLGVALRVVALANLLAAGALAVASLLTAAVSLAIALVALAVDVGAFAVSQIVALRRREVAG